MLSNSFLRSPWVKCSLVRQFIRFSLERRRMRSFLWKIPNQMVLHFTQHQIVLWTSLFNTETAFKSSFRNYFSLDTLSNIVLARRYTVVFGAYSQSHSVYPCPLALQSEPIIYDVCSLSSRSKHCLVFHVTICGTKYANNRCYCYSRCTVTVVEYFVQFMHKSSRLK